MTPEGFSAARILQLKNLNPQITEVALELQDSFLFLPGQWVDFFIPEADLVGGFSITTTPGFLSEKNQIELAIKDSRNAAVRWLRDRAREGDVVAVRAGGACVFQSSMTGSVLLIAGGIGITPMLSIWRHLGETAPQQPVTLLYSGKNREELVYAEEIQASSSGNRRITFLTTQTGSGRLDRNLLSTEFERQKPDHVFLCGPEDMLRSTPLLLKDLGLADAQIHFEAWW